MEERQEKASILTIDNHSLAFNAKIEDEKTAAARILRAAFFRIAGVPKHSCFYALNTKLQTASPGTNLALQRQRIGYIMKVLKFDVFCADAKRRNADKIQL